MPPLAYQIASGVGGSLDLSTITALAGIRIGMAQLARIGTVSLSSALAATSAPCAFKLCDSPGRGHCSNPLRLASPRGVRRGRCCKGRSWPGCWGRRCRWRRLQHGGRGQHGRGLRRFHLFDGPSNREARLRSRPGHSASFRVGAEGGWRELSAGSGKTGAVPSQRRRLGRFSWHAGSQPLLWPSFRGLRLPCAMLSFPGRTGDARQAGQLVFPHCAGHFALQPIDRCCAASFGAVLSQRHFGGGHVIWHEGDGRPHAQLEPVGIMSTAPTIRQHKAAPSGHPNPNAGDDIDRIASVPTNSTKASHRRNSRWLARGRAAPDRMIGLGLLHTWHRIAEIVEHGGRIGGDYCRRQDCLSPSRTADWPSGFPR